MRRLILVTTAMALSAACTPTESGSLGEVPIKSAAASATPAAASPAPGATSPAPVQTITLEIWFTRDGKLFPTRRTRPLTPATSGLALSELAAGPTSAETAVGVRNAISSGTKAEISVSGGVATIDLPGTFYDGGRDAARLRQAQVVYTLTQFPTVSSVGFQRDGKATGWPVRRSDYEDLLPAIVVTSVAIGQRVPSPVTVAGTANVYEATVSIRILDAAGKPVATTFTTATCGSGCRGDYTTAVKYRLGSVQAGTLQVYQVSADDGSALSMVSIPVILGG